MFSNNRFPTFFGKPIITPQTQTALEHFRMLNHDYQDNKASKCGAKADRLEGGGFNLEKEIN